MTAANRIVMFLVLPLPVDFGAGACDRPSRRPVAALDKPEWYRELLP